MSLVTPLTAVNLPGDFQRLDGEIADNYVHKYETQHYPETEVDKAEEILESLEGVSRVETEEVSSSTDRYRVEVYLDTLNPTETENYVDVLESSTAWNQTL